MGLGGEVLLAAEAAAVLHLHHVDRALGHAEELGELVPVLVDALAAAVDLDPRLGRPSARAGQRVASGSRKACSIRWVVKRLRVTKAEPASAASASPTLISARWRTFPGKVTCGAPGFRASKTSVTGGSTSYSTLIRAAASRAASSVVGGHGGQHVADEAGGLALGDEDRPVLRDGAHAPLGRDVLRRRGPAPRPAPPGPRRRRRGAPWRGGGRRSAARRRASPAPSCRPRRPARPAPPRGRCTWRGGSRPGRCPRACSTGLPVRSASAAHSIESTIFL